MCHFGARVDFKDEDVVYSPHGEDMHAEATCKHQVDQHTCQLQDVVRTPQHRQVLGLFTWHEVEEASPCSHDETHSSKETTEDDILGSSLAGVLLQHFPGLFL